MMIQILLLLVLIAALVLTWKRAKEQVIRRREAMLWTLLWIGAGAVVLWPDLTTRLAEFVGIGRGADLAVYGSVILLFILVFRLHVAIDKLERTMTKMVRRDALRDLNHGTRDMGHEALEKKVHISEESRDPRPEQRV